LVKAPRGVFWTEFGGDRNRGHQARAIFSSRFCSKACGEGRGGSTGELIAMEIFSSNDLKTWKNLSLSTDVDKTVSNSRAKLGEKSGVAGNGAKSPGGGEA
jgi:hypothetical protein